MKKRVDFDVLNERALAYAELIVKSTTMAEAGHASSALSLVHITSCLMEIMNFDEVNPFDRKNDVLVLSEGHAVPVIYAAWAMKGVHYIVENKLVRLKPEDLTQLRDLNSPLDGHPSPLMEINNKIYRMPFHSATGALGQGLSQANGIALADRFDGIKRKIFVICGDSEIREGQNDEALRFATTHNLPITLILNLNKQGQSALTKDLVKYDYKKEFEAKGLKVLEINGHNVNNLMSVLDNLKHDCPTVILADTIKGWGVSELQKGNWHGKALPKESLNKASDEIHSKMKNINLLIPIKSINSALQTTNHKLQTIKDPEFNLLDEKFKLNKKISARKGYGYALRVLGENKNFIVVDAEVSNSTMTEIFKKRFPERYIECAIAEQNMLGVASGLASIGKVVFANTFARFIETCLTQWNITCQSRIPLHLVGSHVGLGPHSDGPSQMGLADVAYMISIPNITIFSASDGVSAYKLTELAAQQNNPTYNRNFRQDVPLIYSPKEKFIIGGCKVLKKGKIYIVAHGYMVHIALSVASKLKNIGIIDAYCLKPFDEKTLLKLKPKAVLSLEDNFSGLSNIVSQVCSRNKIKCEQMCVDRWPKSARKIEEELNYCGIDENSVIERVKKLL